eukprot:1148205-Pelagomonas_calceolata.AAC.1
MCARDSLGTAPIEGHCGECMHRQFGECVCVNIWQATDPMCACNSLGTAPIEGHCGECMHKQCEERLCYRDLSAAASIVGSGGVTLSAGTSVCGGGGVFVDASGAGRGHIEICKCCHIERCKRCRESAHCGEHTLRDASVAGRAHIAKSAHREMQAMQGERTLQKAHVKRCMRCRKSAQCGMVLWGARIEVHACTGSLASRSHVFTQALA